MGASVGGCVSECGCVGGLCGWGRGTCVCVCACVSACVCVCVCVCVNVCVCVCVCMCTCDETCVYQSAIEASVWVRGGFSRATDSVIL